MKRKGEWICLHKEGFNPHLFIGAKCSICKMHFGLPTPYCPNCGARMSNKEIFKVSDIVEVVRCKDCKHRDLCPRLVNIRIYDKEIDAYYLTSQKLSFCSYGERREK